MTYVYERTNHTPILSGEDDFLSYLPRYVGYWRDYKERQASGHAWLWGFDASFLDARILKAYLLRQKADLETFAGVFYGLSLFSQVAHYYKWFIWGPVEWREQSERFQIFHTVNGVLSLATVHMCPAVMPSMLLYVDPDSEDGENAHMSGILERDLWTNHADIFDRGVQVVLENIDYLTYARTLNARSNRHLLKIYFNEHAGLRLRILTGDRNGRLC